MGSLPRNATFILALALAPSALAGPWSSGEQRPLPPGPTGATAIGTYAGAPGIVFGGSDGVRVLSPDGTVRFASDTPVADLLLQDLDYDGTPELITCSEAGLQVLRPGSPGPEAPAAPSAPEAPQAPEAPGAPEAPTAPGAPEAPLAIPVPPPPPPPAPPLVPVGFRDPIVLGNAPCEEVVALQGDLYASLVTRAGTEVTVWTPGGDGLVSAPFQGPANATALVSTGGRFAVVGDTVVTGPVPETLASEERPVGVAPAGPGWALAYGGDAPRLVLPDGSLVPLPGEPVWMESAALSGPGDLLVGLQDGSVVWRTADNADVLELGGRPLAHDDLDGDGCRDLILDPGDGARMLVLGQCGATAAVPEPAAPAGPETLELGTQWAQLDLGVGERVELQLVDTVDGWTRFAARGGPPGLTVTAAGALGYTPLRNEVGLWRVRVLLSNGKEERWSGIVVRVQPRRSDVVPEPEPTPPPAMASDNSIVLERRNNAVETVREPGFFGFRECLVSAGIAAGLSNNTQESWANVGLPDAVPSASPAITMTCAGGGEKLRWFVGADSAPTFFYLTRGGRQNHVLGVTLGAEWRPGAGAFRTGPFVNGGLVILGVGLRTVVVPFETKKGGRHGLETRLAYYPGSISGSVLLGYTWEFGEF